MACVLSLKSISVPMHAISICKIDSRCFEKRMGERSLKEHGVQSARRSTDIRDSMLIVSEACTGGVSAVGPLYAHGGCKYNVCSND